MGKERKRKNDWTELLLQPGRHWEEKIGQAPVVKLTFPNGAEQLAITVPVIKSSQDHKTPITSLYLEYSETDERDPCILDIPVEKLKRGRFQIKEGRVQIEYAGLAGEPQHKNRKWSSYIR